MHYWLSALAAAALLSSEVSHAQFAMSARTDFPVPNGPISALVETNGTLFIGGDFSRLGYYRGAGLVLDNATLQPRPTFPVFDGPVHAVVPDNSGGFYVGGAFTTVGTAARARLARIRADRTVDTTFNPAPNAPVFSLFFSGDALYVGGNFTTIGRQPRRFLAAVQPGNGNATAWNPQPDGPVAAITFSGSRIYLGGNFNSVGGVPRTNLASVDAIEGIPLATFNPSPDAPVAALVISGTTLYVGGSFTNISGAVRSNLAAVNSFTGVAEAWNPAPDAPVSALTISGGSIFVGGQFATIGERRRRNFASVDATTGLAALWDPAPGGPIKALALAPNGLWLGGDFTNMGQTAVTNIALIEPASGRVSAVPIAPDEVRAIAVNGGNTFVGSVSPLVNSAARNAVAAIDIASGSITSFDAHLTNQAFGNISVTALALGGETLYAGGSFLQAGDKLRTNLVALNLASGAATDWAPSVDGAVAALAVSSNIVFVGGSFTNVSDVTRTNLAAFDSQTGAVLDWNPSPNSRVNSLSADGADLFVGGAFTALAGENRRRIASFNLGSTNLELTAWQPEAIGTGNSAVFAILPTADRVYVGGAFASIGGQFRTNLAALNRTTGTALDTENGSSLTWNTPANNVVRSIALLETNLYIAGDFTSIGGRPRASVALLNSTDGSVTAWDPDPNGRVATVAVAPAGAFLGGQFSGLGSFGIQQARPSLAAYGVPFVTIEPLLQDNEFGLLLRGTVGERLRLDLSTDLVTWQPLATNTLSAPVILLEPATGTNSAAFFRISPVNQ